MLKIRLARVGKRGHATFRIVVTEHTRPPKSGSLETLGSYDPHTNRVQVDAERLKDYLTHGAQVSPTLHNLFIENKVLEGTKVVSWKPKKKQGGTPAAPAENASAVSPAAAKSEEPSPPTPEALHA